MSVRSGSGMVVAVLVLMGTLASCSKSTTELLDPPLPTPALPVLSFVQSPTDRPLGEPLGVVTVDVRTPDGALDPRPTTIELSAVQNATTVLLGGQTSASGLATFTPATLPRSGRWVLVASGAGVTPAVSRPFVLEARRPPRRLRFVTGPHDLTAGETMTPAIEVEVVDAAGERVAGSFAVTLEWWRADVSLDERSGALAREGVARFEDVVASRPGRDFTLRAVSEGLEPAVSERFEVFPDRARLAFRAVPSEVFVGETFALEVLVLDHDGALLLSDTEPVTISGPSLDGTLTQRPVDGVARFDDLRITRAEPRWVEVMATGPRIADGRSPGILALAPPEPVELGLGQPIEATRNPSLSHDGDRLAVVGTAIASLNGSSVQGVYVIDRATHAITLVSTTAEGTPGNNWESDPHLTPDGDEVVWTSGSTNLVMPDANGFSGDVLSRTLTGTAVQRISEPDLVMASASDEGPLSADHRWAVFVVQVGMRHLEMHLCDRDSGTVRLLGAASSVSLAGDGRTVFWTGTADRQPAGGRRLEVMALDLATDAIERVSVNRSGGIADDGSYRAFASADGRIVAFNSMATDLVSHDTNGVADVFVRDRDRATTTRVSVSTDGVEAAATPSLSSRLVGAVGSEVQAISADGRFVLFLSTADNLGPGDTNGMTDLFVHDLDTSRTRRIRLGLEQGNEAVAEATLSGDGRVIAASTYASNLFADDTNDWADVLVVENPLAF